MIRICYIKHIIGDKVRFVGEIGDTKLPPGMDLTELGTVVGIKAKDINDLDKGVLYSVKFSQDWVLEEVEEDQIRRK